MNGTVDRVIKHSFLYSLLLSQPFASYIDFYPVLQNKMLEEAEQLGYGHHGEIVRVLQKKLNKLSYYEDEIDGNYGILTEHAVKKFQADHDISVTGQTDQETVLALIAVEKDLYLNRLKHLSSTVNPGMHGEDVKIVQEALTYFGYYEGEIDGIYGPLTAKALEIAEEEHGIELTTEVTQESLETLYEPVQSEADANEQTIELKEQMLLDPEKESIDETIQEKAEKDEPEIKTVPTTSSSNGEIIETARSLIGTPYVWGGDSPSGFDCSGFIQYVYQEQDMTIPRTVNEIWNFSQPADDLSVGNLVFFETYKPGPSHVGIYLGNDQFIHAGASTGVVISNLSNSYWKERYLGTKRIEQ